ncbi:MAG: TIGR02281 family clan AA aspartic protease [Paracoccaceae bacterium]
MDGDSWANLAYLVLLGGALVSWYVVQNRASLGTVVKQAGAWVFIFIGVVAVIGLWDDIRQTVRPTAAVFADEGRIEIPRAPDGHYYLTLMVNDAAVKFVVDTGATGVVLSRKDAERAGLELNELSFYSRARTANGEVRTAPVHLNRVALGGIEDHNVPAFVNEGELFGSLLGMSYLQRWSKIEIGNGQMVLSR